MFERFTDRARRVVVLAQEEARLLDHDYIGTEHILLGLIHEGEGVAAQALASLDIDLDTVRRAVEQIVPRGESAPYGHIPFTPRAKKVLELSLREAIQLGHNYIGTEHILLGLIREREGAAAKALVGVGADLSRVRERVVELVSGLAGPGTREDKEVTVRTQITRSWGMARAAQASSGEVLDRVVFRRFTVPARRVMLLAESEALRLGQDTVGVEHLLLGLLAEEEGVAARAVGGLGFDLAGARATAERLVGRRTLRSVPEATHREDVVDAIERALHEALSVGSERIDTEHLLLGIVHQSENRRGMARQALVVMKTSADAVRRAVADTEPAPDPGEQQAPITSVLGSVNLDEQPDEPEPEDPEEGEAGAKE